MKSTVVRFSGIQRAEHASIMLLFVVLAVTGLPQKYFDQGWAQTLTSMLGGIDPARWMHRAAGILFVLVTTVHLGRMIFLVVTGRSKLSLVPTRQDFRDAIITLRYYLGVSDQQARFDRFDYRQKFEYWGLVLGAAVVGATGFVLLYPTAVTRFLPGQVIPAAQVAHSYEGLMAFLVVIVWHIYNAHLNPDVFPFDTTIFTGRISRERVRHEHPLEYERMLQNEKGPGKAENVA
jgi:formate dehydrogenase subunit gamma